MTPTLCEHDAATSRVRGEPRWYSRTAVYRAALRSLLVLAHRSLPRRLEKFAHGALLLLAADRL